MASIREWQYHVCDTQQSDLKFLVYVEVVSIPLDWMPVGCRVFVDNRTFWSCLLSNNLTRQQSWSYLVWLLRQEHQQRLRSNGNEWDRGFGRDRHSQPRERDSNLFVGVVLSSFPWSHSSNCTNSAAITSLKDTHVSSLAFSFPNRVTWINRVQSLSISETWVGVMKDESKSLHAKTYLQSIETRSKGVNQRTWIRKFIWKRKKLGEYHNVFGICGRAPFFVPSNTPFTKKSLILLEVFTTERALTFHRCRTLPQYQTYWCPWQPTCRRPLWLCHQVRHSNPIVFCHPTPTYPRLQHNQRSR